MRHHALAAAGLFAAGWAHQGAHDWLYRLGVVPEDLRGQVWNISGGLFVALLLFVVGWQSRSTAMWIACALLIGHALQVVACSSLYLWRPWPLLPGDSMCSDGIAGPLGVLGAALTALAVRHGR